MAHRVMGDSLTIVRIHAGWEPPLIDASRRKESLVRPRCQQHEEPFEVRRWRHLSWPPDETFVTDGLPETNSLQLASVGGVYDGAWLAAPHMSFTHAASGGSPRAARAVGVLLQALN